MVLGFITSNLTVHFIQSGRLLEDLHSLVDVISMKIT
jgi:hypothetical protein